MRKAEVLRLSSILSLLCITSTALILGCGKAGTGSLVFQLAWEKSQDSSYAPSIKPQALPSGVVGLRVTVSASDMEDLVQTFTGLDSTTEKVTVSEVPVGENRTIFISGMNSLDEITYSGSITGVVVEAGKTTNAGTITMIEIGDHCQERLDEEDWEQILIECIPENMNTLQLLTALISRASWGW